MRVLIMESDPSAAAGLVAELQDRGHEVVRCHDPSAPAFPCNALTGRCPLDDDPVEVAVVVREHPWPRPTALERGVTCAIRARVPLVVAGRVVLNPYEPWATEVVEGTDGLVDTISRLMAQEQERR